MVQIGIPSESFLLSVSNRMKVLKDLCSNVKEMGESTSVLAGTGTFDNAPESPATGTQYFCTDKQTAEGETNGIVIYYNGTDWVDALGRAIT